MNASDQGYNGPSALYASITGSPLWGKTPEQVIADRVARGWYLNFSQRVQTPYGLGPLVNQFVLTNGREVIWIPSYGIVYGEDTLDRAVTLRRLFWILYKAGVKVLIVGGTSGTNDWRGTWTGEGLQRVWIPDKKAIHPGDFVLPWSFNRLQPMVGYLPGTGIGGLLPNLPRLADPFCVELSPWLASKAEALNFFRRVHRTADVHVILQQPLGEGSFESEGEVLLWRTLVRMASQDEGFPYSLLHGDCISPLMARHLGIHVAYYHIAANWAEGHPAAAGVLTETLDELYVERLPPKMLDFEADVLASVEVPTNCTCVSLLKKRPDIYHDAMTQAS